MKMQRDEQARTTRAVRRAGRCASALVLALLSRAAAAPIQTSTKTPEPPPRPSEYSSPQTPPPAPAADPTIKVYDVDVNALTPYNLPAASRERMHECGLEWRNRKLAGETGDVSWRPFAEKCLAKEPQR